MCLQEVVWGSAGDVRLPSARRWIELQAVGAGRGEEIVLQKYKDVQKAGT